MALEEEATLARFQAAAPRQRVLHLAARTMECDVALALAARGYLEAFVESPEAVRVPGGADAVFRSLTLTTVYAFEPPQAPPPGGVVPLPPAAALLPVGLGALALARRRRRA